MDLAVLTAIQSFHNSALDCFFSLVTNLGSDEFYIVILALMYWCVGRKLTFRLGIVFLTSQFVNVTLKDWWQVARPIGHPGIRSLMVQTATGYSLPSGHAQGAATFWGYLALKVRRRVLSIWSVIVVAMVGYSRLYLGVHWPSDVALGLFLGLVVVFLFIIVEQGWLKLGVNFAVNLALAAVLPFGLLLFDRSGDMMKIAGFLVGLSTGYVLEDRWVAFKENQPLAIQAIKLLVGYVLLFAAKVGIKALLPVVWWADLVRYAIIGLMASLGVPYLYRRCRWG